MLLHLLLLSFVITMMHLAILCFVDMNLFQMLLYLAMHPVVTNLLQEIDNGIESRTTPIQERGDDEDIAASDMYTLKSDSSTTWTLFPSRITEIV